LCDAAQSPKAHRSSEDRHRSSCYIISPDVTAIIMYALLKSEDGFTRGVATTSDWRLWD